MNIGSSIPAGKYQQAKQAYASNRRAVENDTDTVSKYRKQSFAATLDDEKDLYSHAEQQKLADLRQRDQSVRQHEKTHQSMGGEHVRGGITYEYEVGPDGKKYAVGGEVHIDAKSVSGNARETYRKMETIKRAALAPNDPSPQDIRAAMEATRRAAAAEKKMNESEDDKPAYRKEESAATHQLDEYKEQNDHGFKVDGAYVSNLFEMYA
jgi:hypothetical protein